MGERTTLETVHLRDHIYKTLHRQKFNWLGSHRTETIKASLKVWGNEYSYLFPSESVKRTGKQWIREHFRKQGCVLYWHLKVCTKRRKSLCMATFTGPAMRFVDHINMCWFYRKKCQAIYTRSGADDVYNGFDSEAIYVQFLFTCEFCSESGQV